MFKLIVVGVLSLTASALNRPVNEEIVKEIRAKTCSW
jgi:hypothetical protein